jgi:hypothetical protein
MRRINFVVVGAIVLTATFLNVAGAATSLYPATLRMQHGMYESNTGHALPWGTMLTAAESRWVILKSSGSLDRWGVWKEHGTAGQLPVRSTDGGAHWMAAGPQLASDWAGGGIYYVSKVISEGLTSVVMVSNAVIDVTTDGGRQWYQYLNSASDWIISGQVVKGGIGPHIRPFPDGDLAKGSYANYVLDISHHEWLRTRQSAG